MPVGRELYSAAGLAAEAINMPAGLVRVGGPPVLEGRGAMDIAGWPRLRAIACRDGRKKEGKGWVRKERRGGDGRAEHKVNTTGAMNQTQIRACVCINCYMYQSRVVSFHQLQPHIHAHAHTGTHAHTQAPMHACMHTGTHTHTHMCAHTHTLTYLKHWWSQVRCFA